MHGPRRSLPMMALLGVLLALADARISADAAGGAAPAGQRPAAATAANARLAGALEVGTQRERDDVAALVDYRPSYPFWQHVFTIPDGSIAYGSARDGRLLATFPTRSDWTAEGRWITATHRDVLLDQQLSSDLDERREQLGALLEPAVGPVLHNPTRGLSVAPNALRYGRFLSEWGAIYERFGVPRHLGLAQALVESGFNGTVRSEANALGLCQWLQPNWRQLQRLAGSPIEAANQTTQAAYCAAHLTILATKYGSFIPALSEHHAGGTNIGRTLINGERLGAITVREQYFAGSDFARDLRTLTPGTFSDVYGTYGPRSYRYAEMIFGNVSNVAQFEAGTPQQRIFAMRVTKSTSLSTIARLSKLTPEEIRRFNPALRSKVPAGASVYLPKHVPALGRNVTFWHTPATAAYATVLESFVSLNVSVDEWNSPSFDAVLQDFRRRFAATRTEEGGVMATMLGYVLAGREGSGERAILAEFRTDDRLLQLFDEARAQREELRDRSGSQSLTN